MHYHADRAWEGIWQAIVLWVLVGGGWAAAREFFQKIGATVNVAFYGALVVAIPIALAVIFFQRNARILAMLSRRSDDAQTPPPDKLPQDEGPPKKPLFIPWPKALSIFLALASTIAVVVKITSQVTPEDPKVTFGEFPDVQKKILRTMWIHQKSIQANSGGGFLYPMPIHPGTAEYIEFHPHLDALSKHSYIQCNCFDEKAVEKVGIKPGCYCYFLADGINMMLSIGELSTGPIYNL